MHWSLTKMIRLTVKSGIYFDNREITSSKDSESDMNPSLKEAKAPSCPSADFAEILR